MKTNLPKLLALLFLFFKVMPALSQPGVSDFDTYKSLYPDQQAIFLNVSTEMFVSIEGDSLRILLQNFEEILHLGENSKMYAQDKVYTSSFVVVSNLSAKTLLPDKKKYKSFEVTEFKESFDRDSYVFYDDSKYINFTFPSIQPGAKTQLSYTETLTDPRFLSSFRFGSYLPVVNSKFSITFDKGIVMDFRIFNDVEGKVKKEIIESEGRSTYSFTMSNTARLKFEQDAPSLSYEEATVVPIIKSYTRSNGTTTGVLGSTDDLFQWYQSFTKDLKKETPEIKAILSGIIDQNDTELEKVKKIFYWVQGNIKYIAFEQGMRGFIPHPGEYVLNNRYGDCKDMSSIIISLLHNAGIDGKFTWIGTRDIPYKYSEIPTPIVDNHMIATYINNGAYYFLDATGHYTPFGMPTSMIQGKEALIAMDEETFEIKEVPVIDAEANLMSDVFEYNIADGQVTGSGQVTLTGFAKVFNTYKLIKADNKSVDDYVKRLLSRGSNKFFVSTYQIDNLQDRDLPLHLTYEFRTEDYYRTAGNDIYFNMNMDKAFSGAYIKEDRVHSIQNEYKYTNSSTSVLNIPDDYAIKSLPKDSSVDTELFSYNISYLTEGNKVVQKRTFKVTYLLMSPAQFATWNEAIRSFTDASRQVVILTRKETE